MSRYLAVALPDFGHLLPMLSVVSELRLRGHEVVVVTVRDRADVVRDWGCELELLAPEQLPDGWLREVDAARAGLSGDALNRCSLEQFTEVMTRAVLADLPRVVAERDPDAVVVDPYCYGAASVAEAAGVRSIGVEGALAPELVSGIADPFAPWDRQGRGGSWLRRLAAAILGRGRDRAMRGVLAQLNGWRASRGLPEIASVFEECARLERLRPQPRSFEPPGYRDDLLVQHCGAFVSSQRPSQDGFPWEQLDERPIAYASLGTIAAERPDVFRAVAESCAAHSLRLVIGLGGHAEALRELRLPGDPLIARWAPQLQLLERAAVCFTHAGLNTTLEALWHGVPLLAMPSAFDQPGVARRVQLAGCGLVVPPEQASAAQLGDALGRLLREPQFAAAARRLGDEMRAAGGVALAATRIERCGGSSAPALSDG